MATVEPYYLRHDESDEQARKKALRYMVQYRTPDRRLTKKRGFKTKKAAQKFAIEVESSKDKGTFINPAAGKASVSTVYKEWEPSQDALAVRTKKTNLSTYRVHIEPRWGNWPVNRITSPDVRKWVADMQADGKKRDTILRALHVLRAIMEVAVETKRIHTNPVQKVKVRQEMKKRRAYLSPLQVEVLAGAATDAETKALIYTLAYVGLRISELAALDVADFDATASRLSITKAVKGDRTIGPTKTYETRNSPVPAFLAGQLSQLIAGRNSQEPLFRSPNGLRIDVDNFRDRVFATVVKSAQEAWTKDKRNESKSEFPRVTPHSLRHTCASLAISTGAHVKAVQGLLGHESAAITLNVYSDLFPDDLDSVGIALNALRDSVQSGEDVAKT
ncbi:tyrosine-type recombinase/integrase [Corynebacterium hindlerae]|uniref:tyrosine-type recombinase/integrase n=1 Tax=Corynebacterium hindlerae TaxID=699041 RepID=UPI003AAA93EA